MTMQLFISDALPTSRPPTDRENATRIVRHGLADILEWLKEPVGPAPHEPVVTHMVLGYDPASDGKGTMVAAVSREMYDLLREKVHRDMPVPATWQATVFGGPVL